MTDPENLQTNKGQEAAETRFRLLKSPAIIDGFFLKKPSRIEALGIIFVMVLLIYGILEYRIREKMKRGRKAIDTSRKAQTISPDRAGIIKAAGRNQSNLYSSSRTDYSLSP